MLPPLTTTVPNAGTTMPKTGTFLPLLSACFIVARNNGISMDDAITCGGAYDFGCIQCPFKGGE